MIWTHIYDLILKLATTILAIFTVFQIPYMEHHGVIGLLAAIVLFFILYNLVFRTIATYLYCRLTLKMDLSLTQAKSLNDAFSPLFPWNLKWLPMKEIKSLDNNVKYQAAIALYQRWKEETHSNRKMQVADFKRSKTRTKILTVTMYALVGYFIISSFLNIPPSSWLTEAYCSLFNTQSYYPALNWIILTLPTIFIFKMVDKNIK